MERNFDFYWKRLRDRSDAEECLDSELNNARNAAHDANEFLRQFNADRDQDGLLELRNLMGLLSNSSAETRKHAIKTLQKYRNNYKSAIDERSVFRILRPLAESDTDNSVKRAALLCLGNWFVSTKDAECCRYFAEVAVDRARAMDERCIAYRLLNRITQPPSTFERLEDAFEWFNIARVRFKNYSADFDLERDADWNWINSFLH